MDELMFDGSFARSKLYFRLLQILRIFSESIKETRETVTFLNPTSSDFAYDKTHFQDLIDNEATRPNAEHELRALESNWKIISQFYDEAEKLLLQRIATKTEEIKTLRDGVSG